MVKRFLLRLLIVVAVVGSAGWWEWRRVSQPYRSFTENEIFVELPPGAGVGAIAARLAQAGVVPDAWTFRIAARIARNERRLQAGEYRFTGPATPFEVAWRLAHGDVFKISMTFPEGLVARDMAAIFARSGLGTADDFLTAATDVSLVSSFDPEATDLEGYLFPDTYAMSRHAGAAGVVQRMVKAFQHAMDSRLRADAAAQGLSVRSVVTLASIIEKETARPEERPLVSAVYRNRLKMGMALQCDPTVIYALERAGRWNGNLTHADLQMDSPYNTYRYAGLPPGPIAAPGKASLDAALHPADVPYLYFVSRNDGTHVFATTLAEHLKNVQRWQVQFFKKR
jgi:UPF0755 protein